MEGSSIDATRSLHKELSQRTDALNASDVPRSEGRLMALFAEMDAIHFANRKFWEQPAAQSPEALCEYYRRQDRLEEIRNLICGLTG